MISHSATDQKEQRKLRSLKRRLVDFFSTTLVVLLIDAERRFKYSTCVVLYRCGKAV